MKNTILTCCFLLLCYLSQAKEIDPVLKAEIASFTDSLVELQINNNIAEATVSVLKGYGKADVENDIVVVPEKHLFRIGSISKMFVWTSIMQLMIRVVR